MQVRMLSMVIGMDGMIAVVKTRHGPGNVELKNVDRPKLRPDEIVIGVKAAAICGSDIGIYQWARPFHFMHLPIVMGHEYAGEVVEIGDAIEGFKVGDRVTGLATIGCGLCVECRMGRSNICAKRRTYGVHMNGAFAQYLAVPARYAVRLPIEVPYEVAAPVEAIATTANAVIEQASIRPGSNVAVLGPGPIGLYVVQFLRLLNVQNIIITGTTFDKERLGLATRLGADHTIDVTEEHAVEKVRKITEDRGVDVVFETSGSHLALQQGVAMLRRGGHLYLIGLGSEHAEITSTDLVREAITLQGVYANTIETFEYVLSLIRAKKIHPELVTSNVLPIEEIARGFELAKSKKGVKVVFTFQ